MHTSFYQSLVQKLQAQPPTDPKRIRRAGHFAILSTFLESFDVWAKESLDQKIDTGELVMTFSNVNQDVVEINAQAIGIVDTPAFKGLKLGRLHDLVGRRNEIGHGAVIEPPPNEHFLELWQFTESLINKYCDAFLEWVEVYTGEIEPDNLAIRRQKQARAIKRQSTMRKSPAWRRRNSSCE